MVDVASSMVGRQGAGRLWILAGLLALGLYDVIYVAKWWQGAQLPPLGDFFGAIALAGVVVASAYYGSGWGLDVGKVVAFMFLITLLLNPIAEISEIVDQTQTAIAGWRKVLAVLDVPIDVVEPDAAHEVDLPAGALSVESKRTRVYSQEDVHTLSVIAAQAAIAIENAHLYQESQDSVQQMQALLHVAQMINGSLNLPTVLDGILDGIHRVMPYHFAAILLPDESGQHLKVAGVLAPETETERAQTLRTSTLVPVGEGVTGRVFASGEPLLVPDIQAYGGYFSHDLGNVRSELAVALVIETRDWYSGLLQAALARVRIEGRN